MFGASFFYFGTPGVSRAGDRYCSLQDLSPTAGKPAKAPPLRARVCAPRPPAAKPGLQLLLLCGTAACVVALLSFSRARASAPDVSMDGRRVPVRAGWANPRGGSGGYWAQADSLQVLRRSAAYQLVALQGGARLGSPRCVHLG